MEKIEFSQVSRGLNSGHYKTLHAQVTGGLISGWVYCSKAPYEPDWKAVLTVQWRGIPLEFDARANGSILAVFEVCDLADHIMRSYNAGNPVKS